MDFIQLQDLRLKSAIFPSGSASAEDAIELAAKSEISAERERIDRLADSVDELDEKLADFAESATEKDALNVKLSGDQTIGGKKTFEDMIDAKGGIQTENVLAGQATIRTNYDTFNGLMVGASHSEKDPAKDGIVFIRTGGTDTDPLRDQGSFVKCVGKLHTKDVKVGVYGKSNSASKSTLKDLSGLQMVGDMGDQSTA